jgi:hypothetical protein
MAVKLQVDDFWVLTPCSVAVGYQHFREYCCPQIQSEGKMEAAVSSETVTSYSNTSRLQNPEITDLEKLFSYNFTPTTY